MIALAIAFARNSAKNHGMNLLQLYFLDVEPVSRECSGMAAATATKPIATATEFGRSPASGTLRKVPVSHIALPESTSVVRLEREE
jgi:hypothetical protein